MTNEKKRKIGLIISIFFMILLAFTLLFEEMFYFSRSAENFQNSRYWFGTVALLFLVIIIYISNLFKEVTSKFNDDFRNIKDQIRLPENLFLARERILVHLADIESFLEKKLKPERFDEIKGDLEGVKRKIPNIESINGEFELYGRINDFREGFVEFDQKLREFLKEPNVKLKKSCRDELIGMCDNIKSMFAFVENNFRVYEILLEKFNTLFSKHQEYLGEKANRLDALIDKKLSEDFNRIKDLKENEINKIKQDLTKLISEAKRENGSIYEIFSKQKTEFQDLSTALETLSSRMNGTQSGYEAIEKILSGHLDTFNGQNESYRNHNRKIEEHLIGFSKMESILIGHMDDLGNEIDKLNKSNLEFKKMQEGFSKAVAEIEAHIKTALIWLDKSNKVLDSIKGIESEYSVQTNKFSGALSSFSLKVTQLASTTSSIKSNFGESLKQVNAIQKQFEENIKNFGTIRESIYSCFLSEFNSKALPEIVEIVKDSVNVEEERKTYKSFILDRFYKSMESDTLFDFIKRLEGEPDFSESYRNLTIAMYRDLVELEDIHKDEWYWEFVKPLMSQLDSVLVPFLYVNGETIYDRSLSDKPEGFSLSLIKKDDLRKIINQDHWIQIWEPVIRWAGFYQVYLNDEAKFLKEWFLYYSSKIGRFLTDTLSYRLESYRPLETVSQEEINKGHVKEVPDHIQFYQNIFPKVKEKVIKSSEKFGSSDDQQLVIFVDQVGLWDNEKRIRESKVLFYNPLLFEQVRKK